MTDTPLNLKPNVSILRVFQARARPGCENALSRRLASSSVAVVKDFPGNLGYLIGTPGITGSREFMFCSWWKDADALRSRFGADWPSSYLPAGYGDLIETCSVQHYQCAEQRLIDD